ncbi:Rne/Rng family ribonuclease [Arthrobacter sp. SDTb3-6]|uniref:Rne/Rng family ribonuclease n=1 Tax=Arthrobacter sp. SDTb3-6 TaxID=2713571 RepID=UPI00159D8E6A|nr:Rne/Rng family ribonuclease [Arthrobacter sp. SDTb3-6]NVM98463.1 ribonuclease E/G [Arthrobacter sp. SDTb3-6]
MDNEQPATESSTAAAGSAAAGNAAVGGPADGAAPAKARRPRRATATVTDTSAVSRGAARAGADAGTAADVPASEGGNAAPAKKAPVRRSRAKKAVAETPDLLDGLATADQAPTAPTSTAPAADAGTAGAGAAAPEAAAAAPAEARKAPAKRATRRRATSPVTAPAATAVQGELSLGQTGDGVAAAAAPAEAPAAVEAPAKKAPARRSRAKASAPAVAAPAETTAAVEAAEAPAAEAATTEEAPARATRSRRKPAAAKSTVKPVQEPAAGDTADADTGEPTAAADATQAGAGTSAEASGTAADAAGTAADAGQATAPASSATDAAPAVDSLFMAPGAGISGLFLAPDLSLAVPAPTTAAVGEDHDAEDEDSADHRRGRGRNRNRRNKSSDHGGPADVEQDNDADGGTGHAAEAAEDSDGVTSRRRRRRRRGDADLELTGGTDEDPPNTVTKVRAPRPAVESSQSASNRVTSLRGSTRLEAKKQRRRDSRDSGRRRTVITEAEFLARRESVDRVMVVRQNDDRIQIGVLEDGILAEHFVSKTQQDSLIGNVYLGRVQNVLPSMEAAFVDIGRGRNAVLYAGEVDWDAAKLNGQPRRIENALKSGDSVLVQVSKDPVGHKGARLTSQVSLPGRYLVYVPGGSMTGISRKLPDVERNRLKRVLKDHLPENAGVIVRTAAEGASEEELTNDINRLRAQWEGISTRAASSKTLAPEMLYAEPDLTIKVVRDVFNEDFTKLIVSGEEAWDTIEAYVTYVAPDLLDRLEKWTKSEDIFGAHRIDEQISKALERKVFLPSGGSLVIDRTEAMTVVDVNTGKFTGSGGNLEETVTKNNLEAAEEVVRQLRLRDIGGIIVIDFIDMVLESNRDLVLRRLVECLGRDRTKHQVAEVTSLGLVQMTRKRMGTGLLEVFGELCEACAGRGMVTHEIPVEHRRVHTVAAEQHHPQPGRSEHRDVERTANRSTRSERKRNRNRSQQHEGDGQEAHEHLEAAVVDPAAEAERQQKATQARAALASIAAAAAAAHHEPAQDGHAGNGNGAPARTEPGRADDDVAAVEVETLPTSLAETATVTLGGEAVALPRGHHPAGDDHRAEQAAALAGLAQALDQLAGPKATDGVAAAPAAAPTAAGPGTGRAAGDAASEGRDGSPERSRSRRPRRNRSARSAQGGADMSVETSAVPAGQGGTPHTSGPAQPAAHTGSERTGSAQAETAQAGPAAAKEAAPIIMLGVGVPASEL